MLSKKKKKKKKASDVSVQYPVHLLAPDADRERIQRVMLSPAGPEPVGEADKVPARRSH